MVLAKIFHLIAVVHFYFGIYYDVTYVTDEEIKLRKYEFGGKFVYLTWLTFVSLSRCFDIKRKQFQGHEIIFFYLLLDSPSGLFHNCTSE